MNHLFYGDNLTVLRDSIGSASVVFQRRFGTDVPRGVQRTPRLVL